VAAWPVPHLHDSRAEAKVKATAHQRGGSMFQFGNNNTNNVRSSNRNNNTPDNTNNNIGFRVASTRDQQVRM
jgi:formylglycine-generating enzyme required for sulfatase activity